MSEANSPASEAKPPPAPAKGAQSTVTSLTVDAAEGAMLLGIGRTTFYKLHTSGRLPLPVRFGAAVRWRIQELQDWLNAGCPPRDKWRWAK